MREDSLVSLLQNKSDLKPQNIEALTLCWCPAGEMSVMKKVDVKLGQNPILVVCSSKCTQHALATECFLRLIIIHLTSYYRATMFMYTSQRKV